MSIKSIDLIQPTLGRMIHEQRWRTVISSYNNNNDDDDNNNNDNNNNNNNKAFV